MERLPEDPKERAMWNEMVDVLADGNRLKLIHLKLWFIADMTPNKKLARTLALIANDLDDLLNQHQEE
ncbi:MAG: hypothetical protein GDA50_04305 [Alphaproteobacteria bacterium GM202ARS2]|nr:hypothetical protein [Alphaproteobacteria bacterium GM202ARS2]